MTDRISPALTPEEWASLSFERDDDPSPREPSVSRHGVAALALYGQPFGFTRQDVAFLQSLAAWHHTQTYGKATGWRQSVLSEVVELRNLADRIAALLPPETPV